MKKSVLILPLILLIFFGIVALLISTSTTSTLLTRADRLDAQPILNMSPTFNNAAPKYQGVPTSSYSINLHESDSNTSSLDLIRLVQLLFYSTSLSLCIIVVRNLYYLFFTKKEITRYQRIFLFLNNLNLLSMLLDVILSPAPIILIIVSLIGWDYFNLNKQSFPTSVFSIGFGVLHSFLISSSILFITKTVTHLLRLNDIHVPQLRSSFKRIVISCLVASPLSLISLVTNLPQQLSIGLGVVFVLLASILMAVAPFERLVAGPLMPPPPPPIFPLNSFANPMFVAPIIFHLTGTNLVRIVTVLATTDNRRLTGEEVTAVRSIGRPFETIPGICECGEIRTLLRTYLSTDVIQRMNEYNNQLATTLANVANFDAAKRIIDRLLLLDNVDINALYQFTQITDQNAPLQGNVPHAFNRYNRYRFLLNPPLTHAFITQQLTPEEQNIFQQLPALNNAFLIAAHNTWCREYRALLPNIVALPTGHTRSLTNDNYDQYPPRVSIFGQRYNPRIYNSLVLQEGDPLDPTAVVDFNSNNRASRHGVYYVDGAGFPHNPVGLTGLAGKGNLPRWGPNSCTLPIFTRLIYDRTGNPVIDPTSQRLRLQVLVYETLNNRVVTLPNESVEELQAKIFDFIRALPESRQYDKAELEFKVARLFINPQIISDGYFDSPRNTDNAWREILALEYHLFYPEDDFDSVFLAAGSFLPRYRWVTVNSSMALNPDELRIAEMITGLHGAHWQ